MLRDVQTQMHVNGPELIVEPPVVSPLRWTIRPAQADDAEGIGALFETVFRKPLTREHWRWKLHTLPTPTENEWVAQADGKIVGHYAVTPIRFCENGREVLVPHGCDAMTHPDFRRQGILSALGARANQVWQESGAPFQIGFHYGGWGSVREQLGWRPVARLVWVKKILQPLAYLARRMGASRFPAPVLGWRARQSDSTIHVERVHRAGIEFDRLWDHTRAHLKYGAVRDRAWVQWRYLDKPDVEQRVLLARQGEQPCGYLAYRIHRDSQVAWAVILDVFASPQDPATPRALLQLARGEFAEDKLESVAALVVTDSPLYGEYRRAGFWPTREGFDFSIISYDGQEHGLDPRDWFVTGVEGDVV